MDDKARPSQVIGDIYDAALDLALWHEVVADADFVPGAFVNLFWQDATRNAAQAFFTHGIEERFLRHYLETYVHLEGGGGAEVSRTLGISEATVKTHRQRLFGKTGVTRPAELIKLVACFMSPLGE